MHLSVNLQRGVDSEQEWRNLKMSSLGEVRRSKLLEVAYYETGLNWIKPPPASSTVRKPEKAR